MTDVLIPSSWKELYALVDILWKQHQDGLYCYNFVLHFRYPFPVINQSLTLQIS